MADDGARAYVADANNHALRTVDLRTGHLDTVHLREQRAADAGTSPA